MLRTVIRALLAAIVLLLALFSMPAFALAADAADQPPGPVITGVSLTDVLLGLLVPLVGYLLNHFAPWVSEQAKALVQIALAAGAAFVAQAVGSGDFGWNQQTLVAVLTVMGTAVAAHLGYKAGGLNVALGAGSNADGKPVTQKTLV